MKKIREQGKIFVRDRLQLLFDNGLQRRMHYLQMYKRVISRQMVLLLELGKYMVELFVSWQMIPLLKQVHGEQIQLRKLSAFKKQPKSYAVPMIYLVDSAGARITDQLEMFPGRRGAGRIFYNQVKLSGKVPQICLLFGPSAAGGAYIPAFCDIVVMVEGNASMYLGSPRMAEMVIGEKVTLEANGWSKNALLSFRMW